MRAGPVGIAAGLVVLALGSIAGCDRSLGQPRQREPERAMSRDAKGPAGAGVSPGIYASALIGRLTNPYTANAGAIQNGRELFNAFNCSGCHSGYAGGGMGPNLRDSVWIYGGTDADLFATISAGRPNGMPAWGGRIPDDQIWRIIAYLRTLGTRQEPEKPPTPTRTTMPAAREPT